MLGEVPQGFAQKPVPLENEGAIVGRPGHMRHGQHTGNRAAFLFMGRGEADGQCCEILLLAPNWRLPMKGFTRPAAKRWFEGVVTKMLRRHKCAVGRQGFAGGRGVSRAFGSTS